MRHIKYCHINTYIYKYGCIHTWSEPEFDCSQIPPSWFVFIMCFFGSGSRYVYASEWQLFTPLLDNDCTEDDRMNGCLLASFLYFRCRKLIIFQSTNTERHMHFCKQKRHINSLCCNTSVTLIRKVSE